MGYRGSVRAAAQRPDRRKAVSRLHQDGFAWGRGLAPGLDPLRDDAREASSLAYTNTDQRCTRKPEKAQTAPP